MGSWIQTWAESLPCGKLKTEIITIVSLLSSFLHVSSDCDHLAIFMLLTLDTSSVQARKVQRDQVNEKQKLFPEEQCVCIRWELIRSGYKCYLYCLWGCSDSTFRTATEAGFLCFSRGHKLCCCTEVLWLWARYVYTRSWYSWYQLLSSNCLTCSAVPT